MDLSKYSVKGNAQPINLSQYSVASSAPTVDDLSQFSQQQQPETLSDKLGKRVNDAKRSIFEKSQYPMQPIIGTTGAIGGGVNDIISAVLHPYLTKLIDITSNSKTTQDIATSKVGSSAIDLANKGVDAIGNTANKLKEKYPNASQFATDVFNTSTFIPTGGLAKEGMSIVSDVARSALTPSESSLQKNIIQSFNKAVKPTAKRTLNTAEKYDNSVVSALKEIKNNSSNLNLEDVNGEIVSRAPHSLNELSQALDQTKSNIFQKYDALTNKTGERGITLATEPIAKELDSVATNRALELTSPEIINYARTWSDRLRSYGSIDVQTAQEAIKLMNKNLESFYKNPTYENASKAAVDAGIVNNLRKSLDTLIENATGENYQGLKNAYGSLKSIENDVVRASMRDARKNAKGLLDYTDMFTGGQMISGILSLKPAMFTKGAIERGFKEYIKHLNDPNRVIKGIFDALDKSETGFVPKSNTGKFLQNQYLDGVPLGLSTKAHGKK